jgi:hypothetical protein
MEASRLRDYLKAKEGDANKPWNKPNWPGPKVFIQLIVISINQQLFIRKMRVRVNWIKFDR